MKNKKGTFTWKQLTRPKRFAHFLKYLIAPTFTSSRRTRVSHHQGRMDIKTSNSTSIFGRNTCEMPRLSRILPHGTHSLHKNISVVVLIYGQDNSKHPHCLTFDFLLRNNSHDFSKYILNLSKKTQIQSVRK